MRSTIKKLSCILLSAAMIFSMSACGKKDGEETENTPDNSSPVPVEQASYDTPAKNVKKSETVYVNLDPEGKVTDKTVTDWLHTDTAEAYIDDISDLSDIQNVKSDIVPVKNDNGTLRWHMPTTDIYYRGTTKRELPVNFKITYYLNGKETSAADIAGKSGQVKMVITMNNESVKEVKIDGKKATVYTPFIVAGGMVLNESTFSNVTVENGKTIGDGTKEIALLVGVPGIKESLNISDDILKQLGDFNFSSTYTITLDTDKFELSNMIFAVLPLSAVVSEINENLPASIGDLKAQLGNIQTVIDKLNGMNFAELTQKLFSNTDDLAELASSVSKVTKVYNDNKALIDVMEKYMTAENMETLKRFIKDTENVDYDELIKVMSNPVVQRFFKELPTLAKDMQDVLPIINGLSEDLADPKVQKAVNELPKTLETLKELKKTLDNNKDILDTLGEIMNEDTMSDLEDILGSLEGVIDPEVMAGYSGLIDNADELIARAEQWIKAGQEYNIFTTAAKGVTTSVMFIYETSPITAPVENKTEEQPENDVKDNAVMAWFKKLFKKSD